MDVENIKHIREATPSLPIENIKHIAECLKLQEVTLSLPIVNDGKSPFAMGNITFYIKNYEEELNSIRHGLDKFQGKSFIDIHALITSEMSDKKKFEKCVTKVAELMKCGLMRVENERFNLVRCVNKTYYRVMYRDSITSGFPNIFDAISDSYNLPIKLKT
jgi:hypothetical protein